MRIIVRIAALAALLIAAPAMGQQASAQSDKQIRQAMIDRSIATTPGNCPCPYNVTANGSRCGGRSSYSRPGGNAPLCFDSDISDEMVAAYRQRNRN